MMLEPVAMRRSRGFSLVELMVVLLIMGTLLIFAVDQYLANIKYVQFKRALVDLEEIAKTVRLYQIREEKPFPVATFSMKALGSLVGTYFEKVPPLDPWGRVYLHNPKLGLVYSLGEDGIDGFSEYGTSSDDVVTWYFPRNFFIKKAEYVDANRNNQIDFGDFIEITFSRPAKLLGANAFDFISSRPSGALNNTKIEAEPEGNSLKVIFIPPVLPDLILGETMVAPRPDACKIIDFSNPPASLDKSIEVVISPRKL